jgi:hypothetical protein
LESPKSSGAVAKASALQEVALLLRRRIMKPAAAFGRGAAGFDLAQKVVGRRQRLSLDADRETTQRLWRGRPTAFQCWPSKNTPAQASKPLAMGVAKLC